MSWLVKLALVALLAAALVYGFKTFTGRYVQQGVLQERGAWQAQQAKDRTAALESAAEDARRIRRTAEARQIETERISNEIAKREGALRDRLATSDLQHRSLLGTIESVNQRNAELSGPGADARITALTGEAATARGLLGECSGRRREVAGAAAGLADQVTGLQAYAAMCQKPPEQP